MTRTARRGTLAGDPGWSNCVFCGTAVGKSARSREHIIPMWLLRATGDPNRKIKIDSDPVTGADIVRPASTFHFPACEPCNEKYGKTLEKRAKKAIEPLMAGKSLQVSQCYWLLDWLDKVRVGLWLGYNMLHKEEFAPKFRIDQRIGIKDRIAIISVVRMNPRRDSGSVVDNQIFRTSQAGMFFKINNIRILSLSFDGLISRFAGMPFPEELLALRDDPKRHIAVMGRTDYRIKQDWMEFQIPGATVIAQTSFWLGNCLDEPPGGLCGLSGHGLARICRRLDVPYPPRGYWASKSAGKKVIRASPPGGPARYPIAATITPSLPASSHLRWSEPEDGLATDRMFGAYLSYFSQSVVFDFTAVIFASDAAF